jgi:hypothetical protein
MINKWAIKTVQPRQPHQHIKQAVKTPNTGALGVD